MAHVLRRDPRLRGSRGHRSAAQVIPDPIPECLPPDRRKWTVPGNHRPLTFSQELAWLLLRAETRRIGHPRLVVSLEGTLDVPRFRRSLEEALTRQDALRSAFRESDDRLLRVDAPLGASLGRVVVDQRRCPDDGPPETGLRRLLDEDHRRPFALDRPPLLRTLLVRTGKDRHTIQIVAHALVADAESLEALEHDLWAAYAAQADGREGTPHRPAPRRTVAGLPEEDQPEHGEPRANPDSAAYWRERLAALPEPPVPSPVEEPGSTQVVPFALDADLMKRLGALAAAEGGDGDDALLTALVALLSRFDVSGAEAVLLHTVPGRPSTPAAPGAAGRLSQHLPLRVRVDRNATFRAALGHVVRERRTAIGHLDASLVEALGDEPATREALAAACRLSFRSLRARQTPALDGVFARTCAAEHPDPGDGLIWTVRKADDGTASGGVAWRSGVASPDLVDSLVEMWLDGLTAMVERPDERIGAVSLTPRRDLDRIAEWNRTSRALDGSRTVDELVLARVRDQPDAPALEDRTGRWTYAELAGWSAAAAAALRAVGVTTDRPVGIHMTRSAAMVAAMLGVLRAGGAYLVLDPKYPAERLVRMVRDTGAAAVLHGGAPPDWLAGSGLPGVPMPAPDEPAEFSGRHTEAQGLANIVFTSGSTGRPKGVAVPHEAVVRLVGSTDYVRLGPRDVIIHLGDPSFDITTLEVWGALCNGAHLVVLPGDEPLGPDEVIAAVRRHRPTVLSLTATLFHRVAETDPGALESLRHLFVVGEVMNPAVTRRVLEHGAPAHLVNGYGPTENTTFSACHEIRLPLPTSRRIPIGKAITNTSLHVLDPDLKPVPVGAPGELYVGGTGLARGYVGCPELTAERFLPHPFADRPGERLYRTGDLVRRLPGGELDFLGRLDDQVKIRGYRIEPGEIEAAIMESGMVSECAVRVVELSGDRRLAAYLVPAGIGELDQATLRTHLQARLPGHLVPNHFVWLPELPMTTSGKLDVRALTGVGGPRPAAAVVPRTATEREVWRIWSELLQIQEFGVHDDFFAIGGHSLLATGALAAARARLHVDIQLRSLFDHPTVATWAAWIDSAGERGEPDHELASLAAELERIADSGSDSADMKGTQ
ncbi:amino acid adenylation domain-containing protein [Streptomyces goshikiensis]|uniref:non-ribosomal peptide synthetase n=1 Tax=Streptomyces goshikiensis TaxID=1942 RepID=UPI0036A6361A